MSLFRFTILACLAVTATFSTPTMSVPMIVGPPTPLPVEPESTFEKMIPSPTSIPESPEFDMDLDSTPTETANEISPSPEPTSDLPLIPQPSQQPANDPFMDTFPAYTPDASMAPMEDPYHM